MTNIRYGHVVRSPVTWHPLASQVGQSKSGLENPPVSLNQPVGRLRSNGSGEAKHQSRGELAESHCPPRLGQVAHLVLSDEDVARRKEVLTRKV